MAQLQIFNVYTRYIIHPEEEEFHCSYINREAALKHPSKMLRPWWVSQITVNSWTGSVFSGYYFISERIYFNRDGEIINHIYYNDKGEVINA